MNKRPGFEDFEMQHLHKIAYDDEDDTTNLEKPNFLIKIDMLPARLLSVYRNSINGLRARGLQTSNHFLTQSVFTPTG